MIYVCPDSPPPSHFPKHFDPDDISGVEDEDWWVDEDEDEDEDENVSDMDSMVSEMMRDIERELFSDGEDYSDTDSGDDEDDDEEDFRYMAILQTSRQIHNEAQSLFYSEATLVLEPGDIFSLVKKPQNLKFGYPNPLAWKHNPLFGIGKKDKNGVVSYGTPPLDRKSVV